MGSNCTHSKGYCGSDKACNYANQQSAEIGTRKATAVTALAGNCMYQKEDPTDYGNGIQNTAPEVVPRRERSVCLRKKHIGCFGVDFDSLVLFHVFFTLSSAIAEILHL